MVIDAVETRDLMSRLFKRRRIQSLVVIGAALVITAAALSPTAAVVRFEPKPEPVPERWAADVVVAVEWAGVSMRIPASWNVSIKREPATGFGSGASLLAASGAGDTLCMLDVFDPAQIETWQDVGVEAAVELTIAGHHTERFDDMWGTGTGVSSAYSIYADGHLYSLLCSADQAPTDRWLSIAETFELLSEGE